MVAFGSPAASSIRIATATSSGVAMRSDFGSSFWKSIFSIGIALLYPGQIERAHPVWTCPYHRSQWQLAVGRLAANRLCSWLRRTAVARHLWCSMRNVATLSTFVNELGEEQKNRRYAAGFFITDIFY